MEPLETVRRLCAFPARVPGSDAERRAAAWLARTLRASGREARVETVWVRPHWAAAHALHALLGVAASLGSLVQPVAATAVAGVALVLTVLDLTGRAFPTRLLTFRRATQNVVSPPRPRKATRPPAAVRLVLLAAYDARGTALGQRPAVQRAGARIRRRLRGRWPSPLAWLALALALVTAASAARIAGVDETWLGAAQLVPTVGLLIGLALLVDVALADPSPDAAGASAVATALEVARRLDAAPPERLDVELALCGAGDGPALGARAYLRARRRWDPAKLAVLELRPCAGGRPRWWTADGPLAGLRLHPRLVELAAEAAEAERHLDAAPVATRAASGAYRARRARWPALALGALDEDGVAPRAHTAADLPAAVDSDALRDTVALALALVDRLDADLARTVQG